MLNNHKSLETKQIIKIVNSIKINKKPTQLTS